MKFKLFFVLLSSLSICLSACGSQDNDRGVSEPTNHEHTYSSSWSHNDTHHWHNSTCGHDVVKDKEPHTFSEWSVEIEPSYVQEGRKKRTCPVCGYYETSKIDKLVPPYNTDGNKTVMQYGFEITELPYFSNGLTIMSIAEKSSSSLKFVIKNDSGKVTSEFCKIYYKKYDANGVVIVSDFTYLQQMEIDESSYFTIISMNSSVATLEFGTVEFKSVTGTSDYPSDEDVPMSTYYGFSINTLPYTKNKITIMSIAEKSSSSLKFLVKNETGRATSEFCKIYYKKYDANGVVIVSDFTYLQQMEIDESSYFTIISMNSSVATLKFGTIEVKH